MKISAFITITIACLLLNLPGFSQEETVTFSQDNASLSTIFSAIQKQTGFSNVLDNTLMKQAKRVNLHVTKMPLRLVLEICFREQSFGYEIVGKVITLVPAKKPSEAPEVQRLTWLTVNGRVLNEMDAPVPGATITAKTSNRQTSTNQKGEFSLNNVFKKMIACSSAL